MPRKLEPGPLSGCIDATVIKMLLNIADLLRSERKRSGLTQYEVAEMSGLPRTTVSRLENARHDPELSTLSQIAGPLQIDVIYIIEYAERDSAYSL